MKKKGFKTIIQSAGIIILTFAIFSVGQNCFNKIIENDENYHPEAQVVGGLRYFEIDGAENGSTQIQNYYEGEKEVRVIGDNDNVIDSFKYTFESKFSNHLKFIATCLKKNPSRFIRGYIDNYMVLCDLYNRPYEEEIGITRYLSGYVEKQNVFLNLFNRSGKLNHEIDTFAGWLQFDIDTEQMIETYSTRNWFFWNDYVTNFRDKNSSFIGKMIGRDFVVDFFILVYAIIIFLAPIRAVYYFVKCVRKNYNIYISVQLLINLAIFSQTVFFSLAGTVVDRYMYPSYVLGIFGAIVRISWGMRKYSEGNYKLAICSRMKNKG